MNLNEFTNLIKEFLIIDIRSEEDFNDGHIPNSINIPHVELIKNHQSYLKTDKKYLVVCDEGVMSKAVIKMLPQYIIKDLADGFKSWNGPIESSKQP